MSVRDFDARPEVDLAAAEARNAEWRAYRLFHDAGLEESGFRTYDPNRDIDERRERARLRLAQAKERTRRSKLLFKVAALATAAAASLAAIAYEAVPGPNTEPTPCDFSMDATRPATVEAGQGVTNLADQIRGVRTSGPTSECFTNAVTIVEELNGIDPNNPIVQPDHEYTIPDRLISPAA